jgi:hypothetical protein
MTSECGKVAHRHRSSQRSFAVTTPSPVCGPMFLALPLEIWEMIFDLLLGQDLQLISKVEPTPPPNASLAHVFIPRHLQVPRLRSILAIARRSAHRLEVYRAGFVDVSLPGSRSLTERVELLKEYRARWESLCWTAATCLPPRVLWLYHFARNVLAYTHANRASAVRYLRIPLGGTPASLWEGHQLGLEQGIKTFSAYPEKNLLAVLEEWFNNGWVACVLVYCAHG